MKRKHVADPVCTYRVHGIQRRTGPYEAKRVGGRQMLLRSADF